MRLARWSKSMVTTGVRGRIGGITGAPGVAATAGAGTGTAGSSSLSGVNGVGSPDLRTATYNALVLGRWYDVMSSHCDRSA